MSCGDFSAGQTAARPQHIDSPFLTSFTPEFSPSFWLPATVASFIPTMNYAGESVLATRPGRVLEASADVIMYGSAKENLHGPEYSCRNLHRFCHLVSCPLSGGWCLHRGSEPTCGEDQLRTGGTYSRSDHLELSHLSAPRRR